VNASDEIHGRQRLLPIAAFAEPDAILDMTGTPTRTPILRGSGIIASVKDARVEYVLSVPDITTSDGLLWPIAGDPFFQLIRVCKEDEAIGIAAGLWACGKRSLILIQNTGLLYAMNAIRAIAMEYSQPICLMVGLLLQEDDVPPDNSRQFGVRIVPPILRTLGMTHHVIESDSDASVVTAAIDETYDKSRPVAFLIARSPSQ
jgi:sulfopyruvate decarboxylase subunit alpha